MLAGSVGALFGWLAVRGSAALIGQGSFLIATPSLTLGALVVIACTMVGVGIASGVLPALRATRIDPAVSLRA